jgi:hypothetical protein
VTPSRLVRALPLRTLLHVQLNVSLFILNTLVPAVPLPGSRILADILLIRGFNPDTTCQMIMVTSAVSGVVMIVLGALRIWGGLFGVIVGVWILFSTFGLYKQW